MDEKLELWMAGHCEGQSCIGFLPCACDCQGCVCVRGEAGNVASTKCPDCGLIEGHANRCYTDVLIARLRALEEVAERARILVHAPNDHTKMKLTEAVHELENVEIRVCLFRDSRSKARGSL